MNYEQSSGWKLGEGMRTWVAMQAYLRFKKENPSHQNFPNENIFDHLIWTSVNENLSEFKVKQQELAINEDL